MDFVEIAAARIPLIKPSNNENCTGKIFIGE
jgi:hypothetical protein